jgi:hypothetical protein
MSFEPVAARMVITEKQIGDSAAEIARLAKELAGETEYLEYLRGHLAKLKDEQLVTDVVGAGWLDGLGLDAAQRRAIVERIRTTSNSHV